ncbi:protein transport protein Sec24A-like [Saccoglossus kowalevskii]|uniref:Protein transport protein Sec24B-like n=1 Tax=Saccoglossus kowalevskii TaxID=10224 RepID=A0ABM0MY22_SACKO|nr:PREDICTED: protein transport protein Sec24B-like [Saccoglossus kowalevskii]
MADSHSSHPPYQTGFVPPTAGPPGGGSGINTAPNQPGPPGSTSPRQAGGYNVPPNAMYQGPPSSAGMSYSGQGQGQYGMMGPPPPSAMQHNQVRYQSPTNQGPPQGYEQSTPTGNIGKLPGSGPVPAISQPYSSAAQPSPNASQTQIPPVSYTSAPPSSQVPNSQNLPPRPPIARVTGPGGAPPPLPGQQYQPYKPGMAPPPTNQLIRQKQPATTSGPMSGSSSSSGFELPLPFQCTLTAPSPSHSNVPSPSGSGPPSARSSAAPSPVPSGRYDALEGGTPYQPGYATPPRSGPPSRQSSVGPPSSPQVGPPTGQPPMMPNQPSGPGQHTRPPSSQPMTPPVPQTGYASGPPTGPSPGGRPPVTVPGPPMAGAPPTSMLAPGPPMAGAPPSSMSAPGPPMASQPPSSMPVPGPPMAGQPPSSMSVPGPPIGRGTPMSTPGPPPVMAPPMYAPPIGGGQNFAGQGPPMNAGPPTSMSSPPTQDMSGRESGFPGRRAYPQYPTQPSQMSGQPPLMDGQPAMNDMYNQPRQQMPPTGSGPLTNAQPFNQQAPNQYPNNLSSSMGKLNIQQGDTRPINLLQNRHILPTTLVEAPKPNLSPELKKLCCNPDIFRCTLSSIPQTQQLLNKSKLPLGVLIHPFKDLTHLPVIQSSVIVRCRSCRTYINPFVSFVDHRRWKCNLCYRINDLPEEFNFDPVTRTYGEPQRRPEIKSATIEFIAPSEYMLRPPQPAVYLFMFDVSFNAVESGYLSVASQVLLEELDKLPGDARTMIGFITYDSTLHFYNLQEGLSRPSMMVVSDIEDIFLPCPNDLIVNLQESKELVQELLNQLPTMFQGNKETQSALGPALQAAHKLMSPVGGRVTVFQTCLPSVGPGTLQAREDLGQRGNSKDIPNLGPATDFYKKMSLDCSAQQIAVDLFIFANSYIDVASLSCVSKYSGGSVSYYPAFHMVRTPAEVERFENDFKRYITRKIGFEAVMRIRCTKGLSIHTFHGNFFVRSTDLLSLPNINPDAGFAMQVSIEDPLNDSPLACFQAALLYTSSKGERRIRVHTMCLPVTNQITEVYAGADQQGIIGLLGKMAVDRTLTASIVDARDALVNVCIDSMTCFKGTLTTGQTIGTLMCPYSLRLLSLYVLALLKSSSFKLGSSVRLDERVYAMDMFKYQPLMYGMLLLHPNLYAVHELNDQGAISHDDQTICQPPILSLSSEHLYKNGAYLMDRSDALYLYVMRDVSQEFLNSVLDVPDFQSIPEPMVHFI